MPYAYKVNLKNKNLKAIIACGIAYAIWGLNTPMIKISLDALPLFPFLFAKFLFGSVVFSLFAYKKWRPITKIIQGKIVIASVSGYALTTILLYKGIELTGGLNAALLYLLAPLILYFLSIKVLKERYDKKLLVGVVAGLLGAALILGGPGIFQIGSDNANLAGNACIIGAIFADVIGAILIKPTLKKVPVMQMTATRFIIAAIVLLPFAWKDMSELAKVSLDIKTVVAVIYGLLLATILAFYLYQWGLRKISGEQVSPLHYLDAVFGGVGSIILLGDQLTSIMTEGIALTIIGVYFSETHRLKFAKHISHHR